MLAARVVRLPIARFVNSAKPTTLTASKRLASLVCRYQSGGRASTLRKAKDVTGPTFKERIMAPAGDGGKSKKVLFSFICVCRKNTNADWSVKFEVYKVLH